ncbi:MAG: hypothetical protein LQ347_001885 [Umbilicaria vellea]|nr:MAG: hypothetical protein LQ347_001885 [Umbilicaria vellea]
MSHSLYQDDTPAEVKEAKGLHLITQSTPNGQKVQIMLEELKDLYGTEWTTTLIDISTNEQKKDWFLRLDPNGRIPVIVDNTQSPPFPVMETSAELLYLLKFADKNDEFGFKDELERNQALQWYVIPGITNGFYTEPNAQTDTQRLFFWHGSGAPYKKSPVRADHALPSHPDPRANQPPADAIERFKNETLRVFGVLEIQLSGKYTGEPRDYLAGKGKGKYSVADIGTWPWVNIYAFAGLTDEDVRAFPHLREWMARIAERPAVKRGTGDAYKKK